MKSSDLIYFDNNATTRVDPAVVEEMMPYLTEYYGNPSSGYRFGQKVGKALEVARERVAALLGCAPTEILFTSCGTESTNAAINSALMLDRDRQHIVTTRVEHSATLKHCETLAKRGHEVTWLGVDERGQIDLAELEKSIRRHYYDDKNDATDMARRHAQAHSAAGQGQRTAAFAENSDDSETCETESNLLP